MHLSGVTFRSFRNLEDASLRVPRPGVVLLGGNGQGKTSLLEAIYFPVLFRSLRDAPDQEVVRFGAEGFHVELEFTTRGRSRSAATTYRAAGSRKQNLLDGASLKRIADGAGVWSAVAFQPDDVRLASGPAAGRRLFLDRTLALADRRYLGALASYRRALAQRNAALRAGRIEVARAFDQPLAEAGCRIVAGRLNWVAEATAGFARELEALGETANTPELAYVGRRELAERSAWSEALALAAPRDQARGATTVGPHRDDLRLCAGGKSLREFGSTGQQRSAAIGLKLLELETLRGAAGEAPVLLLDDVFAELDGDRQQRLGRRLLQGTESQVFLTSPRDGDVPAGLDLPVWRVAGGVVRTGELKA